MTTRHYKLTSSDGNSYEFDGELLAFNSSEFPGKPRWFEICIYFEPSTSQFILYTAGKSREPGERTLDRIRVTPSAFQVVSYLIVHHKGSVHVPRLSLDAITTAAQYSDDMLEALREIPSMLAARGAVPLAGG